MANDPKQRTLEWFLEGALRDVVDACSSGPYFQCLVCGAHHVETAGFGDPTCVVSKALYLLRSIDPKTSVNPTVNPTSLPSTDCAGGVNAGSKDEGVTAGETALNVNRPIPDQRGYVTEADGTLRSETDEEFRVYVKSRLATGERRSFQVGDRVRLIATIQATACAGAVGEIIIAWVDRFCVRGDGFPDFVTSAEKLELVP